MAIHNKTNYYSEDNASVFGNGYNDNIYYFTIMKSFNIIQYCVYKRDTNRGLPI
jgi:hypothetical protein